MQAGFDPTWRFGSPLEPRLVDAIAARPPPLPPSDHATRLLDALWLSPDLSMSERDALFVKAAPVLEGMTLTKPPNGGFGSTAVRSVVVGAGPGGVEFNTRLNPNGPVFMQPGYPNKYVEIGPADAATVSAEDPPYREADCKTRSARGCMTLRRMDQEAAANAARIAQGRAAHEVADAPLEPVAPLAPVERAPMQQPPMQQPPPDTQPDTQPPMQQQQQHHRDTLRWAASTLPAVAPVNRPALAGLAQDLGSEGPVAVNSLVQASCKPPSFTQQLVRFGRQFSAAPFSSHTWTQDTSWEAAVILALCALVLLLVIALCVVGAR